MGLSGLPVDIGEPSSLWETLLPGQAVSGCIRKCINYFSVVMIKHHNQKQFMEERVDFGLCFQMGITLMVGDTRQQEAGEGS